MKLGVYDAILHGRSLDEALDIVADASAAKDYFATFEGKGLSLLGLNCNGNPLHPDPASTA